MKNLITTIGAIILILAMIMQLSANQRTYTKLICIDQLVNNFKEVAKEEGCISEKNKANLISQISDKAGIPRENITVSGTDAVKMRGQQIEYLVKVKIQGLLASPRFWGVSRTKNSGLYVINQSTTSEYLVGA